MGDIALRGNKLTAGRAGFALGSAVKAAKLGMKIIKGIKNPVRMDQAQRLKDYHRKTKIQKRKAGRIEEGKSKAFQEKYIKPLSPQAKAKISRSQHPKSWRRAGKGLGGILKGAKEIAKKVFTKKKPVKKDLKPDFSNYPTSKNIHKLIAKEQDPFVRHKLISLRDQAEKGTVIGKGGNVIQTPTKERTAKTLMERHPGSYQRKKPEGKK